MDARFPATVVAREPDAVYRGTVYDQDVTLRVDGAELDVFDKNSLVTPAMVGTTRDVALSVWGFDDAELASDCNPRIDVVRDESSVTVCGDVDGADPWVLDVGPGTVRVKRDDLPADASVGARVVLRESAAQYLLGVAGSRSPAARTDRYLDRLSAGDPAVREEAATYLGERGSPERVLDALADALASDESAAVRCAAASSLGRLAASSGGRERDPAPRVRCLLEAVVEREDGAVGDEARDALSFAEQWR